MQVLVTHNDLDGVACAILFRYAYPMSKYYLESYQTVNETLVKIINDPEIRKIYITDISPNREVARLLDNSDKSIVLIDHHKTALWLREYLWADITLEICAAKNFMYLLHDEKFDMSMYYDFVELVNDWDMWFRSTPLSENLNILLQVMGASRFIDRFTRDARVFLYEIEKYLIELEKEKRNEYISRIVENASIFKGDDCSFGIVFAERYVSEIGAELLKKVDVAVIADISRGTISLRSNKIDVACLAEKLGGGGHENAAGFGIERNIFSGLIHELVRLKTGGVCFVDG